MGKYWKIIPAECTKFVERKVLWGHKWTLCNAFIHKDDAELQKSILIDKKGKIARIQSLMHMGGRVYLVWWR